MTTQGSGLWADSLGKVGATLKALQDAGATPELMKLIRSDSNVASAVVEAGLPFLHNRYADEEATSSYTYPNDYSVKPIVEQVEALAKLLNLDGKKALVFAENLPELPEGAEGWFAIAKWQAVAGNYGGAFEKILALIGKGRRLKSWRKNKLSEQYLRQTERTAAAFEKLCEEQDGDILIIPTQFGLRHRGKSVRRARKTFCDNEFGLGAFAVGCMFLMHSEREVECEQLHIDCAGDEYSPDGDGQFTNAPFFHWDGGELHFDAIWTNNAVSQYGSVSGFAPQS